MPNNLTVATLPLDIAWTDKAQNMSAVRAALEHIHPATDLLVVPELFSTGYIQDRHLIADLAETMTGQTIRTLIEWAHEFNVAIAGSFLFGNSSGFYNRCFFIEPSGEITTYDKKHLFSLSSESTIYSPGESCPPVIRYRGWNISLIVCYDLRFPVWCRNRKGSSYDVMLVPTNWPVSRQYAWEHLLIGRAIENQAYYVGANRTGIDDFGDYRAPMSSIVDPLGKPIGITDTTSGILYVTLDGQHLADMRRKLPFGKDADPFNIN